MSTDPRQPERLGMDEIGAEVRRAWSGASLSAEQRRRHRERLGIATSATAAEATPAPFRRRSFIARLVRLTSDPGAAPRPHRTRQAFELAGAALAFALVAAVLALLFNQQEAEAPVTGDTDGVQGVAPSIATPQGWTYPGWALPGGGQLAFTSRVEGRLQLAVVNADKSDPLALVTNRPDAWSPSWSPDGKLVAFTAERDGLSQVFVMAVDGTRLRQLTSYRGAHSPVWSPDGTRIAFVSTREQRTGIYVIQLEGLGETIVSGGLNLRSNVVPRWSPDSTQLLFSAPGGLYVAGVDGTALRQLTNERSDETPGWSPDGERVVFARWQAGNSDIWMVRADGSEPRNLTGTPDNELYPVWSPDGAQITYSFELHKQTRDRKVVLAVMNADGGNPHRMLDLEAADVIYPAWSPDSARIAFAARLFGTGDTSIFVIDRNGANLVNLSVDLGILEQPVWRPVWWPSAGPALTPIPDQPRLTLIPDRGDCSTSIVARGEHFKPGDRVTLYGSPAEDGSFATIAEDVIVMTDGSFTVQLGLARTAACAEGAAPAAGAEYRIGVMVDRNARDGSLVSDLSASARFTFVEGAP